MPRPFDHQANIVSGLSAIKRAERVSHLPRVYAKEGGTMDFQYTPEQEAYRAKVATWIDVKLPKELCVEDARDERIAPDRETFIKRRAWQRKMYDAGWVGIAWPKQYGGQGAELMEQVIFDEEYSRARAPVLPGYSGI